MNATPQITGFGWRCTVLTLIAATAPAAVESPRAVAQGATCPCNIRVGEGQTMNINGSLTANCVSIETGGKLVLEGNAKLTLTGPESTTVDGTVILEGSASTLSFTSNDHKVTGSGKIKGKSDLAEIQIASGVTLTSDVKITGHLRIIGAGGFINDGCVTADAPNGTLDIRVTGTINDRFGACWRVTETNAMLRFLEEPACLKGDFTVSDGALRAGDDVAPGDDIDVTTEGGLTHTGGKIIAGVNDSFAFNATCP